MAQKRKQKNPTFPFGTWMRSQEEDLDPNSDWKLYRPSSFAFPPARGRSGFICKKDGRFAILQPGIGDQGEIVWGTWSMDKNGSFILRIPSQTLTSFQWKMRSKQIMEVFLH